MTPSAKAADHATKSIGSDRPILGTWIVWLAAAGVVLLAIGIASIPRPMLWNDRMLQIAFAQVDDTPLPPGEALRFSLSEATRWLSDDGDAIALAAPSGEKMIFVRTHLGYGGVERGLLFARTPIAELLPIDRTSVPPRVEVAGLGPVRIRRELQPNWLLVDREQVEQVTDEATSDTDPADSDSTRGIDSPP